jgi:hypothetical protein
MDVLWAVVLTAVGTAFIIGGIFVIMYEMEIKYLLRENRMLWRLLSDQAKLHEMSLDAYIAMLQASSSPTGR